MRSAFTLIELLIVVAIVAVLAVVVVITLNPGQLLLQARDSNRTQDLASIKSALSLYLTDTGVNGTAQSLGSSSVLYVSLPDAAATTTAGSDCTALGLPALPVGWTYHCGASSTFRNTNGQGWIPVNLSAVTTGAPLGQWSTDPVNTSSSGLYYAYVASGTTQFMATAWPESQKQKTALGQNYPVPMYPEVMAQGTSYTINPLFNTSGLVGYWPMDEGSGSSTLDLSGNGDTGSWSGTTPYYATGKVGPYAGNFDGSTDYADTMNTFSSMISNQITISAWEETATSSDEKIVDAVNTPQSSAGFDFGVLSGQLRTCNKGSCYVAGGGLADNHWHFVAMTLDSSNNEKLYVDGSSVGSTVNSSGVALVSSSTAKIGRYSSNPQNYFSGLMDDIRIYSRALSAAEIQALYNAGK